MASPRPLFTRHPFKFIYTTLFLAFLPLRLSSILIYYLLPITRQGRTFRQAVTTKLIYLWFRFATTVEFRTSKFLNPGPDKARFALLDPDSITPPDAFLYAGILRSNPDVQPSKIAAFWYESAPPADTTPHLVILHLHGGAFVLGGARPAEAGWGPIALSKRLECPALMPQYRLSDSHPATCFPAALQDTVTAYTYLLYNLNIRPENIVVSGDSAGGNLVLDLLRYIKDEQGAVQLPSPRAALLWGPWVDPTAPSHQYDNHRNASTDFIFGDLGAWAMRSYIPDEWDATHEAYPYIHPLGREFYTDVPVFLQTSTAEILHDSHSKFAQNLTEIGCRVKLVEITGAPHDTFAGAQALGFVKEQQDTIDQAADFVLAARTS
ncbi:Alpha/Beta hydrolase protein [Aspergillus karnatakaensis]|uniref:Alpha/Beta hydrolase protein n=1 Tax=Aspergillus karnatakaensis TaxID=1810916 RepID=UPI003CCD98EE